MALASTSELMSLLDENSTRFKILEAIAEEEEPVSTKQITEKLAISEKTVRNNLSFLLQNELINRPSRDIYIAMPGVYTLLKISIAIMNQINNK